MVIKNRISLKHGISHRVASHRLAIGCIEIDFSKVHHWDVWIVRVVKAKAITFHTSLEIPNHGQSDWLSFIVWLLTILRDGSAIIWEQRDVTWLAPSIEWWLCEHQINWFDEVNRKIWLLLGVIGVTGGARHRFEQLLKLPNKCFKIDQFNSKCSNDSK